MKRTTALVTLLLAVGWVGALPVGAALDVRAQAASATIDIAGRMLATMDLLTPRLVPPIDPYAGWSAGPAFEGGLLVRF